VTYDTSLKNQAYLMERSKKIYSML